MMYVTCKGCRRTWRVPVAADGNYNKVCETCTQKQPAPSPAIHRTPTWLHVAVIVALLGSMAAWWFMGTLTRGEVFCVLALSATNALIVIDRGRSHG